MIQGTVPFLKNLKRTGCRFAPRIPWIGNEEHEENPEMHEISPEHFVRCTCWKNFYFDDSNGQKINNHESEEI